VVDFSKFTKQLKKEKEMASKKPDKKQTKALQKPTDFDEELARLVKEGAESEPLPAGNFASLKTGLTIGGQKMKDDQADVVIVGYTCENTYYPLKYDSDENNPPSCYSFGAKEDEMRPAENALGYWDPETKAWVKPDSCQECPKNEWGSADQGKGKACQNRRRLGFISANGIDEGGDYVLAAELVQLKLPVTSGKPWKQYVHQLASEGTHSSLVVTRVKRLSDDDNLILVNFEKVSDLSREDKELMSAVLKRREETKEVLPAPYPTPDQEVLEAQLNSGGKKAGKAGKKPAGKGRF